MSSCIEYKLFGNLPMLLAPRNIDVFLREFFNPLKTGKRGLPECVTWWVLQKDIIS